MKRTALLIALIVAAFAELNAQITITRADFPEIGYMVINAVDDVTPVDPGQPGANQLWDFSNLTAVTLDSTIYTSPEGMPNAQNYPEANIATNHNPGSYPYGGYNVNYWNFSDQSLKGVADESLVNLFGTMFFAFHIDYIPPAEQITFPLNYGDAYSQDFTMDWILAVRNGGITTDSSRTVSHVNMDCLVDAWGTIILPDGEFSALRVRETWNSVDSSFVWESGAWAFDETTVSSWTQYRWYANDVGEVGYWNPDDRKGPGFSFFKSETLVGLDEKISMADFELYPNPASNQVRVRSEEAFDRIEILDQAGRLFFETETMNSADLSALPAGTYLVRVFKGSLFSTKKLILKH
jgi:hypothetical protein